MFSGRTPGTDTEAGGHWTARARVAQLRPRGLEVRGDFLPRGGIAIRPSVRLAGDQS